MVEQLCDGQASVSQLAEHLPLGLPMILQHRQVLEQNGLIRTERIGRSASAASSLRRSACSISGSRRGAGSGAVNWRVYA